MYLNKLRDRRFDVIIVDGRDRFMTVKQMAKSVDSGGLLILDNSDWYPNSCEFLRSEGFFQIDFVGFGPINNYRWCTSLFIRHEGKVFHRAGVDVLGGRKPIKPDDHLDTPE